MAKGTVGAPSKASDERVTAICELLAAGNTRTTACALSGISRTTFYRWMEDEDDGSFRDAVEKAEGDAQRELLDLIRRSARPHFTMVKGEPVETEGTWTAAAWLLERRWPQDYSRRERVDMTLDLRKTAERLAEEAGMSADDLLAEAERIVAGPQR